MNYKLKYYKYKAKYLGLKNNYKNNYLIRGGTKTEETKEEKKTGVEEVEFKFKNLELKEIYNDLYAIHAYGPPDYMLNDKDGFFCWKNVEEGIFKKIELKDELIEHKEPEPHCDFLYLTVNIYIPEDQICNILKLSKSIIYDNLKKELTVRCGSMEAIIATLHLVLEILNNPGRGNLTSEYGNEIKKVKGDKNTYIKYKQEVIKMIKENQNIYKDQMPNENCIMKLEQ